MCAVLFAVAPSVASDADAGYYSTSKYLPTVGGLGSSMALFPLGTFEEIYVIGKR